jgi:hypothetical protein
MGSRSLIAKARVRSWAGPCGICGGQCSTGSGFLARSHSRKERLLASLRHPSVCLSVCLSLCMSAMYQRSPTRRISVKCDIGDFH